MDKTTRKPVLVDLALQGGGSHGAFTRGVLDRPIEQRRRRISAIYGNNSPTRSARFHSLPS